MKQKDNSNLKSPIIILVRPQLSQNIGMVARAMMNCGLSQLRLVSPREDHLSKEAIAASSGAQVILKEALVYSNVPEAISDLNYVLATTARTRGMDKPVYEPHQAIQIINESLHSNQKIGILFGPERTGLENSDIILSDALLTIPLNPIHSSLNLSQAVLLVGWSWWKENLLPEKNILKRSKMASKEELNLFLKFLLQQLENKKYFKWEDKRERMTQNLENIFTKSLLSSSEIKTLYRIVKTLSTKE